MKGVVAPFEAVNEDNQERVLHRATSLLRLDSQSKDDAKSALING